MEGVEEAEVKTGEEEIDQEEVVDVEIAETVEVGIVETVEIAETAETVEKNAVAVEKGHKLVEPQKKSDLALMSFTSYNADITQSATQYQQCYPNQQAFVLQIITVIISLSNFV